MVMANGNVTAQTDGNPVGTGSVFIESENFFDALSDKIDGVKPISTPIVQNVLNDNDADKKEEKEEKVVSVDAKKIAELESRIAEIDNVSKRYSDSSREGVRLAQENADLKAKLEETTNPQPKDVFELLGINKENFLFDADEAVKNKNSDSARVLKATQALEVYRQREEIKKELKDEILGQMRATEAAKEEKEFRGKFGYTDDKKWEQFKGYIQETPFSLEAAHLLFTLKDRDENMIKSIMSEVTTHKNKLKNIPDSLSNVNSNGLLETSQELDLEKILSGGRNSSVNYFSK
uniref:Uncharacterized protein n=1 Tax=viral metagenome TaxID=1070528 RepID=A0A6M3XQJ1_9ZZZZ